MRMCVVVLVVGCAAPWRVVVQSGPPSELAQIEQLSVATDFSELSIDGEPLRQFLAQRPREENQAFQEVLRSMDEGFRAELQNRMQVPLAHAAAPPGRREARLTARFVELRQGKYGFAYKLPSELRTRLRWTIGHRLVDEIETFVRVGANRQRPSIIQRLRIAATISARYAAAFFRESKQTDAG